MSENEIGNRGSKSGISVKEQRVDGSCFGYNPKLRCTLMGGASCYPFKILSKQLNNRSFSILNLKPPLLLSFRQKEITPWFITGFSDAEGCFSIKIQPNVKLKTKWRVRPVFSITLHLKDLSLLEEIQKALGVGKISKSKTSVIYAVDSIKEMPVIINHFDNYPLITQKISDYLIFKQCFEIIKQGEHLTEKGLLEILGLKSSLNLGLPDNLMKFLPKLTIKERPRYLFKGIPDPFWISGFTSGDGSFHIVLRNSESKSGVFARFSIHLHIRELEVLKGIASYLKLYTTTLPSKFLEPREKAEASIEKRYKEEETYKKLTILKKSVSLQITKFSDIVNIIIPFFNMYPILGVKSLDFLDFKKVCEIIKTKEHLISPSVLNQVLKIKSGMNLNRKE
jgi:hypothetical protein